MLLRHGGPLSLTIRRTIGRRPVSVTTAKRFSSSSSSNSSSQDHGTKEDHGTKGPLIYPDAPATQHNSLAAFLAHAKRTGLDERSTVFVGTHYEYTVAAVLSRYGFTLRRVGGVSDHGTDLLGTWTPPTTAQTLRVLVQCKAGAQRVGPNLVRELEGAFVGAPAGWRGEGVLALLVSQRPATKGVRDSLGRSRWPMGYVCCTGDGVVRQMVWNRRAEEEGLEGFGVTTRYVEGRGEAELVLLRNGKMLPLLETKE
ncbi:hypothetical protein ACRE_051980 [Hapsidospora chrysogenum ATCC 11550]|uniref:Uncharacterized protein n=1 Tax=Hapsidospora chrysogenum (strain ATCC 11550 / CBS 779.69 / DSM 880 / IAM 14645 / JCM 23072 / IMI 49137) TaxID=857340 RepID=A0A086T3T6_HAPC1|nr:hypothetical protein ACRE_051980 [Hapsidospora chrysogenum ATCC 11550]